MTILKNNTNYLPNLHGLRFIAAILVIVHHIEQFKAMFAINSNWMYQDLLLAIRKLSVTFFFVLSGFLICHLMIIENNTKKKINIKQFYFRRIKRIWPLYFLIAILSLFIFTKIDFLKIPNIDYHCISNNISTLTILYCSFLPQIAIITCILPFIFQAWSIGTEEQFYLIWPILFNITQKNRLLLLLLFTFFISILGIFINYINFTQGKLNILWAIWKLTPIICMLIGCCGALFLSLQNNCIIKHCFNVIYTKYVEIANIILLIYLIYSKGIWICPYISREIYSCLILILIINAATNPNSILKLENKFMILGGKLTYGLYMLHPLAIVISIKIFFYFNSPPLSILIYILSFSITWLLAWLSFNFFESYFLKLKLRSNENPI